MALESGTWVEDLVTSNPTSSDQKSQGDDHLRLIKTVLKNSFKRTSGRAIYFPTVVNKTASTFSVAATDDNTIFRCDTTSGNVNVNLPLGLTTTDAGFRFKVFKTNTGANPVFIGGSGIPVNNFLFIRRTREFEITEVMWTGAEWTATRPSGLIVGQVVEYYGAALPNGFLWCDGSTFTQNLELQTVLGVNTTPDLRGRVSIGRDDMGVGAASRIGAFIAGTTLRASGGIESNTVTADGFTSGGVGAITSIAPALGGGLFSNLPPALVCNKIIVAE